MTNRRKRRDDEETSYWLSYSDMMAALLLIFVLIISFTMMQSQIQYEEKEQQLQEKQELIEKQQEELDKLIGIRKELIEALKEEFDGSDLSVAVDPKTGSITLDSSILFDSGKYNLKPTGENFLKKFIPKYINVLTDKQFNDYISEILIEGHTDSQGDFLYNLKLSQERAYSVAELCLDENKGVLSAKKIKKMRKVVTANGRSYSDPVLNKSGKENAEKSRRVEFSFRLKDSDMITEMSEILEQ